jgi:nitrogen fixation NifU-like protein
MELDELYQSIILDHARRPRNFGALPPPAIQGDGYNPSCGDEISVYVLKDNDRRFQKVGFTGQACAICMASASLMTTQIQGKAALEARELQREFITFLTTDQPASPRLGNLLALGGVKKFPQRLKCATLSWHALETILAQLTA